MRYERFKVKWKEIRSIAGSEYRHIFNDGGVVLVLVLAFLIYSTLYSLAYAPEVLRNVPIGVVDESKTSASRDLELLFDAGPNTYIAYNPTSMLEAEELFFARKIYGIVYIPRDYEKQLMLGGQAVVSVYVDASNFLMYRQVFQEVVSGVTLTGAEVEFRRLISRGASIPAAQSTSNPILYKSENLFNPYLGYGSFIMPAIFMVIIQQTLLIGIGISAVRGARRGSTARSSCPASGDCQWCPSFWARVWSMLRSMPSRCSTCWASTTGCSISR